MPTRQKNFVIVELIIVVAVLALLASMGAAGYSRALDKAKEKVCENNLAQLGKAVAAYAADNGEYYPCAWQVTGKSWKDIWSWDSAISGYDGRAKIPIEDAMCYFRNEENPPAVYHCPAMPAVCTDARDEDPLNSYAMNSGGQERGKPRGISYRSITTKSSSLKMPGEVFLLVERRGGEGWENSWTKAPVLGGGQNGKFAAVGTPYAQLGRRLTITYGHGDTFNYLYADGHVAALKPLETVGAGGSTGERRNDNPKGHWTREPND